MRKFAYVFAGAALAAVAAGMPVAAHAESKIDLLQAQVIQLEQDLMELQQQILDIQLMIDKSVADDNKWVTKDEFDRDDRWAAAGGRTGISRKVPVRGSVYTSHVHRQN